MTVILGSIDSLTVTVSYYLWVFACRFAHLINVDFFSDLLNVLRKIVTETSGEVTDDDDDVPINDTRRTLLCIITAFQLLSDQGMLSLKL